MMFEGLFRQIQELKRLESLRQGFKTASDLGRQECVQCGFCCYQRTCIPTPEELKKIDRFLNITIMECIQEYYCVDYFSGDGRYFVKPVGINRKAYRGKLLPLEATYNEGKCIFLTEDKKCKIHLVKPRTARSLGCWVQDKKNDPLEETLERWDGKLEEIYPKENW